MALVDMKLSPSDAQPEKDYGSEPSKPEYPCGLRVCLDEVALQKLGIDKLPQVGESMMLQAKVEVCAVRQNESQDGVERGIDYQIVAMSLSPSESESNPADKLYGG
jgi:hypothetical protein